MLDRKDSVVFDGKVSDARFMKESSGGRQTETSNTLDITGLGTLLGEITVEEANLCLFEYHVYPQESSAFP